MLDESICHLRGVGSILSLSVYLLRKIFLANNVDPDQTPLYVASDRSLHCLPMRLLRVSRKEWVKPFNMHIAFALDSVMFNKQTCYFVRVNDFFLNPG